jgi:cytochrome c556
MKKVVKTLAVSISLVLVASITLAQVKPEDMIKLRKAGYAFAAWNLGKIKGMVVDNPASFNKDQVIAAANVIAAIANSGMGALFGPGTDKDVGNEKTRVKPEFFQMQDQVKELAMAYIKEANELQKVAGSGDINAIKDQFGKLGAACNACHAKFRKG